MWTAFALVCRQVCVCVCVGGWVWEGLSGSLFLLLSLYISPWRRVGVLGGTDCRWMA